MDISEVWALVHAIEDGSVTLTPREEIGYCGDVQYKSSNGWLVTVFNDCDAWDYFDSFISPTGEVLKYEDMPDELSNYHPAENVGECRYGIPS